MYLKSCDQDQLRSDYVSDSYTYLGTIDTPAFVIDERVATDRLSRIRTLLHGSDVEILYSLKALPHIARAIFHAGVDGFSASSLAEISIAKSATESRPCTLQYVGSGAKKAQFQEISEFCDRLTCNSFSQLSMANACVSESVSLGLRVNPEISFVSDKRYDPCRTDSRLGVPLREVAGNPDLLLTLDGLHIHSNCDSENLDELMRTIQALTCLLGDALHALKWINLGGGYLFSDISKADRLNEAFTKLRSTYGLQLAIEPGAAIAREAAVLVATVIDVVVRSGIAIAILDTTVNHWPEIFEFQFEPDVRGHTDDGQHTYQLAGCSCLAGDIFGMYSFDEPLEVGSRIVFENAGAYSIVKANMFNGINLPTIYTLTESGELLLTKQFTYADFASRCGVETRATV